MSLAISGVNSTLSDGVSKVNYKQAPFPVASTTCSDTSTSVPPVTKLTLKDSRPLVPAVERLTPCKESRNVVPPVVRPTISKESNPLVLVGERKTASKDSSTLFPAMMKSTPRRDIPASTDASNCQIKSVQDSDDVPGVIYEPGTNEQEVNKAKQSISELLKLIENPQLPEAMLDTIYMELNSLVSSCKAVARGESP